MTTKTISHEALVTLAHAKRLTIEIDSARQLAFVTLEDGTEYQAPLPPRSAR